MDIHIIKLMCHDKNVGAVLRRLSGLSIGQPEVTPVINAGVGPTGGVKQMTSGDTVALFADWLKKHKVATIRAAGVKEFLESIGRPPGSYSYLLGRARTARLLHKASGKGTKTEYRVTVNVPALPAPNGKRGA